MLSIVTMLNYRLLDYKAKITKDGNTYVDLLSKVWQNKEPNNGRIIMVNEYYVARPDLISLAVYGSDEYADVLCKVRNGGKKKISGFITNSEREWQRLLFSNDRV